MFPCGSFREAVRTRGDGWHWSHHAKGVKSYDGHTAARMAHLMDAWRMEFLTKHPEARRASE